MSTIVRQQTWDLSGMSGGYEDMCQRMLWRGVAYLGEAKPPVEMWEKAKEYTNIYGVLSTEGADLKALADAIILPGEDVTGAMHQCVMGHLRFIHLNGLEKWHDELRAYRADEQPFEWTGDLDSTAKAVR